MLQADALAGTVHPDLVLLEQEERREIRCLALEGADETQVRALAGLGAFCVYRHGEDAALLYAQEEGTPGPDAAQLEAALSRLGLCAGLSGPFALAASARGCMLKAQIALHTGRRAAPGRALYPMGEFVEAALVAAAAGALAAQGFIREDFCDASLFRMANADAQRDTKFLKSLDAYLDCGMDMKRAAQRLGVHRNTLAYRMARVQERFGLDLGDVNTCFELLFSLWLLHQLPAGEGAAMDTALPFDTGAAQAALWRHVERGTPEGPACAPFACALLCVGVGSLMDEERTGLLLRLRGCAGRGAAFAYDEDVLLAAAPPEELPALETKAGPLCAQLGCPIVSTQAFPAGRIGQHARLCRMALCAAPVPVAHTQALCSTLFFMAVERSTSLSPYLCEAVIRVMDDDAQKGTALSRSLYAYLLHFRDLKRAAQQLNMHRNTMEYHIRKIGALIGEQADGERRFMMMCTYKMLALPEISRFGL